MSGGKPMQNPIDRIQSYFPDFTKTDKEIAIYFINNPINAVAGQVEDIIRETNSSKAALSRFAQKIGYSGYSEFRFDMSRFLVSGEEGNENVEKKSSIENIINKYSEYILRFPETINEEQIKRIAKLFLKARKIKLFAFNRSLNSATQFKQRLARIGIDAEATGDTATIQDSPAFLNKDDLVFIITMSDNTKLFAGHVKDLSQTGCKIVCLTASQNLSFKKLCTEYVVIPRISRDAYLSFLDDQPLFMIFIEILLEEIAKASRKE